MSEHPLRGGDDRLSVLTDPRQRQLLATLAERSHPMTVRDLAVHLAAQAADTTPAAVSDEQCRRVRIDLYHRCLPKLDAAGWIDRRPDGVVAAESPPVGDRVLRELRECDCAVVRALYACPRRRDVLSVVDSTEGPLTLTELAVELADSDQSQWQTEQHRNERTLRKTLHHIDLPKLADLALLSYDATEKTVTRAQSRIEPAGPY